MGNHSPNGEPPYTQGEIDDALTALIAFAGNATGAVRYLKEQGKRAPSYGTLLAWSRTKHWERYEELREKVAQNLENTLANDYLQAAQAATAAAGKAIRKAEERIDKDKDEDPARTAANLMSVARMATDKRLSLQGRPTQIHENRDATAILRGLVAKHPQIFGLTEEPAELEQGGEDDGR